MSSEVKRYDAVHLRYEDSNIRYGEGCEVEVVTASDYAALEAENARLVREAKNDATAYKAVLERQDELRAERDAARAQLAAIQGGMGDADKHRAQPEVAENTGSHAMAKNQLSRQEQAVARDVEGVAAPCEASPGNDIFAWATFDGEGSYDLRLFDGNESYRDDFRRNNPRHHPDWVFPLYRNSITAAMAAQLSTERGNGSYWKEQYQALRDDYQRTIDEKADLRAELAEVKGREAVPVLVAYECCHCGAPTGAPKPFSAFVVCPACGEKTAATRAARYAPASPDVEGLVKALEECAASLAWNCFGECRAVHAGPIMPAAMALDTARAALSTHRQAQRQA